VYITILDKLGPWELVVSMRNTTSSPGRYCFRFPSHICLASSIICVLDIILFGEGGDEKICAEVRKFDKLSFP
jgi:hypothetical protein